jgi:hypothetical protein
MSSQCFLLANKRRVGTKFEHMLRRISMNNVEQLPIYTPGISSLECSFSFPFHSSLVFMIRILIELEPLHLMDQYNLCLHIAYKRH